MWPHPSVGGCSDLPGAPGGIALGHSRSGCTWTQPGVAERPCTFLVRRPTLVRFESPAPGHTETPAHRSTSGEVSCLSSSAEGIETPTVYQTRWRSSSVGESAGFIPRRAVVQIH